MDDDTISRRDFVKSTIAAGTAVTALGTGLLKAPDAQAKSVETRKVYPDETERREALMVREQNKAAFISKMAEEV